MTADVEIVSASQEGALIVPLRAVHSRGGTGLRVAGSLARDRAGGGALGMLTDTEVEITSGLVEGDVVSVVAAPTKTLRSGFSAGNVEACLRGARLAYD